MKLQCDLLRVPKDALTSFKQNRFAWLGNLRSGVWLVRLVEPKVVDHCVVVDGARKLIFDSPQAYPLCLSAEVLRLCGGMEVNNLSVAEAREIRAIVGHIEAALLKVTE